MTSMRRKNC